MKVERLTKLVMQKAGLSGDCSSFTALIQYERDAEKIITIWDKMLEMNVTPDLRYRKKYRGDVETNYSRAFNALFTALSSSNDPILAFDVYDHQMKVTKR